MVTSAMGDLGIVALVAWLAGLGAAAGGLVAWLEGSAESEGKRELVHGVVAFGGGILLAAVAFALLPMGIELLSTPTLAMTFLGGGLLVCALDARLARRGGSKGQFLAMVLDFVPEALALGAVFQASRRTGLLLALFIGLQNLPEGFSAHREHVQAGSSARSSLGMLLAASLLGPLAAGAGYLALGERPVWTAGIMSAAAGGILYLVFQDVAPSASMRHHWAPAIGAVLGFATGMLAQVLFG